MFCTNCGNEVKEDNKYCPKCGNSIEGKTRPLNQPPTQPPTSVLNEGRGNLILILGILSVTLLGFITGVLAWVWGVEDLRLINEGSISKSHKAATKTGTILGVIGTVASTTIILFAFVTGISLFNQASSTVGKISSNRSAMIADCQTIASMGQQHYRKPLAMGGGGNSFYGYEIPKQLRETGNGNYLIKNIFPNYFTIIGNGKEVGDDGKSNIRIEIIVNPMDIEYKKIN